MHTMNEKATVPPLCPPDNNPYSADRLSKAAKRGFLFNLRLGRIQRFVMERRI